MDFEELVTVWYPQAVKIFEATQETNVANLGRMLSRVGKQGS